MATFGRGVWWINLVGLLDCLVQKHLIDEENDL